MIVLNDEDIERLASALGVYPEDLDRDTLLAVIESRFSHQPPVDPSIGQVFLDKGALGVRTWRYRRAGVWNIQVRCALGATDDELRASTRAQIEDARMRVVQVVR